jgi:hypothetical protein
MTLLQFSDFPIMWSNNCFNPLIARRYGPPSLKITPALPTLFLPLAIASTIANNES